MLIFPTDIVIRGTKAKKYQELKAKYGFELVDIYMMSGVLGFINNKKDIQDLNGEITANIPRSVLQRRSEKIDFLYQIIVLYNEVDIDTEKAIHYAFEENVKQTNKKIYKKDLFDDYALGGIDLLYDMLSNIEYDREVDNLKDIVDRYQKGIESSLYETTDEIFDKQGL